MHPEQQPGGEASYDSTYYAAYDYDYPYLYAHYADTVNHPMFHKDGCDTGESSNTSLTSSAPHPQYAAYYSVNNLQIHYFSESSEHSHDLNCFTPSLTPSSPSSSSSTSSPVEPMDSYMYDGQGELGMYEAEGDAETYDVSRNMGPHSHTELMQHPSPGEYWPTFPPHYEASPVECVPVASGSRWQGYRIPQHDRTGSLSSFGPHISTDNTFCSFQPYLSKTQYRTQHSPNISQPLPYSSPASTQSHLPIIVTSPTAPSDMSSSASSSPPSSPGHAPQTPLLLHQPAPVRPIPIISLSGLAAASSNFPLPSGGAKSPFYSPPLSMGLPLTDQMEYYPMYPTYFVPSGGITYHSSDAVRGVTFCPCGCSTF